MKVCIIGAGTSGVICAKVFRQHGIDFDCFERGSGVGGLWRFRNDNGSSSAYRSLHINTSKRMMELSDYPFPAHMAEYPSHEEILEYFEGYCARFDLHRHISFRTEVLHADRRSGGGWRVRLRTAAGEEQRDYDYLVVANGHHWDPRSPDLPGSFSGEVFHSHYYIDAREPVDMRGKRVVVVGSGNSAMDIVCELGAAAREEDGPEQVFLSQRSGVWVIPKVMGNTPQDAAMRHPMQRPGAFERCYRRCLPTPVRHYLMNKLTEGRVRSVAGDPQRFGLKPPQSDFSSRHPTVSQDIHSRLVHGDITPKGDIVHCDGRRVTFEDGSTETVDVIVQSTGYRISFPFFDPGLIEAKDNDIALFMRVFDPHYPDLAFIGLVQTLCAVMPVAELQSHFVADAIAGAYLPPPAADMDRERRRYHAMMKARFTRSMSHTIQIHCNEYSYLVYREWDAGRRRAACGAGSAASADPRPALR